MDEVNNLRERALKAYQQQVNRNKDVRDHNLHQFCLLLHEILGVDLCGADTPNSFVINYDYLIIAFVHEKILVNDEFGAIDDDDDCNLAVLGYEKHPSNAAFYIIKNLTDLGEMLRTQTTLSTIPHGDSRRIKIEFYSPKGPRLQPPPDTKPTESTL